MYRGRINAHLSQTSNGMYRGTISLEPYRNKKTKRKSFKRWVTATQVQQHMKNTHRKKNQSKCSCYPPCHSMQVSGPKKISCVRQVLNLFSFSKNTVTCASFNYLRQPDLNRISSHIAIDSSWDGTLQYIDVKASSN